MTLPVRPHDCLCCTTPNTLHQYTQPPHQKDHLSQQERARHRPHQNKTLMVCHYEQHQLSSYMKYICIVTSLIVCKKINSFSRTKIINAELFGVHDNLIKYIYDVFIQIILQNTQYCLKAGLKSLTNALRECHLFQRSNISIQF